MRCAVLAGLLAWAACVDRGPGPQPKKIEPKYIAEHLLAEPPADVTRLDVPLGDQVVYLGNKVNRTVIAPGQGMRITHYWKVLHPVGATWRVFTLLRGAAGTADFMILPATDMQIGHGPAAWKAGEIIEDVQDLILRPDWRSPAATISVGLIALGEHDTVDRMPASGPHTEDRAVIARVLDVDLSKAPPPPGTVYVPRAQGPIVIDGVAADSAWPSAAISPDLVTAEGSGDPIGKANARLTWDDEYLYAFISVTDSDVWSDYKNHDDPLWKQDCVELFIDADGNRRGYVELQVNPNNATFDSWFATTRAQAGDPKWDSGMQTQVKLRGTSASGDTDQGWDAEIAIPWQAMRGRDEAMAVRLPPQVGDRWRMNIVRVDVRTGNEKSLSASSWNRITIGDFHALDRMLTIVFADPSGSILPQPAGAGSGSASGPPASGSAASGSAASGSAAEAPGPGGVAPAAYRAAPGTPVAPEAPGTAPGSAAPGPAAPGSAAPNSAAPGSAAPLSPKPSPPATSGSAAQPPATPPQKNQPEPPRRSVGP